MIAQYTPAAFKITAFNCPFCGAFAKQKWSALAAAAVGNDQYGREYGSLEYYNISRNLSKCEHCSQEAIWINGALIYPSGGAAPLANPDMPADVKMDYDEARSIVSISPRGAAALLRLAIQKLCKHLGEPGENINKDIASLVVKGLPVKLQQALDSVRVVGNNAVHPGQLDVTDNAEITQKLFVFLNIICDNQITEPKTIDAYYTATIPANLQQAINTRDGK